MISDNADAEYDRRLILMKRAIRRALYTNAALSRRCQISKQRLMKLQYERFLLARRVKYYGIDCNHNQNIGSNDIEIRNFGNSEDLSGFQSSRKYASLENPLQPAFYKCSVGVGLKFEITFSSEKGEITFSGKTPHEAHEKLLSQLSQISNGQINIDPFGQGPTFFGFNQPNVHLSQSIYGWLKMDKCILTHPSFSFSNFISFVNPHKILKEETKHMLPS